MKDADYSSCKTAEDVIRVSKQYKADMDRYHEDRVKFIHNVIHQVSSNPSGESFEFKPNISNGKHANDILNYVLTVADQIEVYFETIINKCKVIVDWNNGSIKVVKVT